MNILSNQIHDGSLQLQALQEQSGKFLSFSSPISSLPNERKASENIFTNSLILLSLNRNKDTEDVQKKLSQFLLTQKNHECRFNYWIKGSTSSVQKPYPNDLDDTFTTATALFQYDRYSFKGKDLAHIVNGLIETEREPGGPYYTWYLSNKNHHHNDIDSAVNSTIAYFLLLHGIQLKNLQKYIETTIQSELFSSPYYYTEVPILFFLSRVCQKKEKPVLLKKIQENWSDQLVSKNTLLLALLILSEHHLGIKESELAVKIESLSQIIRENGFGEYGFFFDPSHDGTSQLVYSKALTISFCMQALSLISTIKTNLSTDKSRIQEEFNQIVATFPKPLRIQIKKCCLKLYSQAGSDEIFLLPLIFAKNVKYIFPWNSKVLNKLCVANVFGWIAYSLYDDILDYQEDTHFLPLANCALKEMMLSFSTPALSSCLPFITKTVHLIDEAYFLEIHTTQFDPENRSVNFPDPLPLSFLANRSMGHALGPLCILLTSGYSEKSKEFTALKLFFYHYLIARQLLDDARDWKVDLQSGQMTYPVHLILEKSRIVEKHETVFWNECIPPISEEISKHISKCEDQILELEAIVNEEFFTSLLIPLKKSVHSTLYRQQALSSLLRSR